MYMPESVTESVMFAPERMVVKRTAVRRICNPLVLYSDMFTTELETLLLRRFKGEDSLLRLCDEAVENSVLLAPR